MGCSQRRRAPNSRELAQGAGHERTARGLQSSTSFSHANSGSMMPLPPGSQMLGDESRGPSDGPAPGDPADNAPPRPETMELALAAA